MQFYIYTYIYLFKQFSYQKSKFTAIILVGKCKSFLLKSGSYAIINKIQHLL